jgi:hypothetical protein
LSLIVEILASYQSVVMAELVPAIPIHLPLIPKSGVAGTSPSMTPVWISKASPHTGA